MKSTPAAQHVQRRVSHFPANLHNISKHHCKGLMHIVGNTMLLYSSSPPCVFGARRVSEPSIFISRLNDLSIRHTIMSFKQLFYTSFVRVAH